MMILGMGCWSDCTKLRIYVICIDNGKLFFHDLFYCLSSFYSFLAIWHWQSFPHSDFLSKQQEEQNMNMKIVD